MSASDYCELCDLPRSQCVHGRPAAPTAPARATRSAPKPRSATTARPARAQTPAAGSADRVVARRWTSPEQLRPLILGVLEQAGGELEADEAFAALEELAGDSLLPGDTELTPEGELRWRYAARRARVALISEGLMTKAGPGVWKLAR